MKEDDDIPAARLESVQGDGSLILSTILVHHGSFRWISFDRLS